MGGVRGWRRKGVKTPFGLPMRASSARWGGRKQKNKNDSFIGEGQNICAQSLTHRLRLRMPMGRGMVKKGLFCNNGVGPLAVALRPSEKEVLLDPRRYAGRAIEELRHVVR